MYIYNYILLLHITGTKGKVGGRGKGVSYICKYSVCIFLYIYMYIIGEKGKG